MPQTVPCSKMQKVMIDPKLFITCRLCLEGDGVYQITPMIQEQIKYAFDIDIVPFDGLSQVICRACDSKVTEQHTLKTVFIEKQKSLRAKVYNQDMIKIDEPMTSPSETLTANEQTEKIDSIPETADLKEITFSSPTEHVKIEKRHTKRRFQFPTSDSDSDYGTVLPKKVHRRNSNSWQRKYTANYICRICSTSCPKRSKLYKHYSKYHSNMQKYSHIIPSFCAVNMNKIDNRPNITGKLDAVVLSKDKIVRNDMNNKYYIVHELKKKHEATTVNKKRIDELCSDSSDNIVVRNNKKSRKKVNRLLSTDTVVIDKQDDDDIPLTSENEHVSRRNTGQVDTSECINIDSESDTTEAETIRHASKTYTSIKKELTDTTDLKTMRNIIEACHSRHKKRHDLPENSCPAKSYADMEIKLKHKILSLGRKVINKQGINCAGLLRFMEYRNLGINWIPRASSKNQFHIRMNITTLRRDNLNYDDTDIGWTNITAHPQTQLDASSNGPLRESNQVNKTIVEGNSSRILLEKSHEKANLAINDLNQAVLYKNIDADVNTNGKLLNANPVANPRQLPKSGHHYEVKPNKNKMEKKEIEIENTEQAFLIELDEEENVNTDLCMPIITSTTSLAKTTELTTTEKERLKDKGNDNNSESTNKQIPLTSHMPRIKVKPVSELMADKETRTNDLLLNSGSQNVWQSSLSLQKVNFSTQSNIANVNTFLKLVPTPATNIAQPSPLTQLQIPNVTPAPGGVNNSSDNSNNTDYFVLNTVEMPNAKTHSPFAYLQRLMRVHSILVSDSVPQDRESICLIKFKVVFKQDNLNPVILCLSLYYTHINIFNLVVKDELGNSIDMQKMGINWEWEILKTYQGNISTKILENAIKAGLQVHDNAKKFICLLKSISRVQ